MNFILWSANKKTGKACFLPLLPSQVLLFCMTWQSFHFKHQILNSSSQFTRFWINYISTLELTCKELKSSISVRLSQNQTIPNSQIHQRKESLCMHSWKQTSSNSLHPVIPLLKQSWFCSCLQLVASCSLKLPYRPQSS